MRTHSFRSSLMARERTYALEPERLGWTDGRGGGGSLAYGDIEKIRIYSVPRTLTPAQYRCVITSRDGGKLALAAGHYKGFGNMEDRSASYAPFVRELAGHVAAANPGVRLIAGQSWAMWLFWLVILVAAAILLPLGAALVLSGASVSGGALMSFVFMLVFLPASWRIVRHGRPHPFEPSALPSSQLPA